MSEKLIGFAHREGELTEDECSAIMYYAKELAQEMAPYCPNHCETTASK
jgi:hypothetical protein